MKITNTSNGIVHIGPTTLLPDETGTFDDSVKSAPAVAMLLEKKAISIAGGKPAKKGGTKPPKRTEPPKADPEPPKAPDTPDKDPDTPSGSTEPET